MVVRSGHRRAGLLITLLAVTGATYVVAAISGAHQLGLISRAVEGGFVTLTEAESGDARQRAIGFAMIGIVILTAVVWLSWQHRAQARLWDLGIAGLKYTPGWAIGWWLVPGANYVMPYRTVAELSRASRATTAEWLGGWRERQAGPLLGVWWGAWLLGTALGVASLVWPSRTPTEIAGGLRLLLALIVVEIVAASLGIAVVRRIDRDQTKLSASVPPASDGSLDEGEGEPAEPDHEPESGGRHRSTLLVGASVAAVLAAASLGALFAYSAGKSAGHAFSPPTDIGPAELGAGWTLHEDPAGFSLGLPPGWEIGTSDPDVTFTAWDPGTGSNVIVVMEPIQAGATLDQYANELMSNIERSIPGVDRSGGLEVTDLAAGPARAARYGFPSGDTQIQQLAYILLMDETTALVVILTADAGAMVDSEPVFDGIASSLRFTA